MVVKLKTGSRPPLLPVFFVSIFCVNHALGLTRPDLHLPPPKPKEISLKAQIHLWTAECHKTKGCLPPRAFKNVGPKIVTIQIKQAIEPGSSTKVSAPFVFDIPDLKTNALGFINVFSIYPHTQSPYPRHQQIQIEWKKPTLSRCMMSVKERSPMQAPPLICTGAASEPNSEGKYEEWGLTVTFEYTLNP